MGFAGLLSLENSHGVYHVCSVPVARSQPLLQFLPALHRVQRLYALCQERGMGMDEFVNGVVEKAVREAEERVLSQGSAARWEVQGELRLGLVAEEG